MYKSVLGKINEGFDYLGYQFKGDLISPRATSIEKLKDSIVSTECRFFVSRMRF
jgi:hypothetical protein